MEVRKGQATLCSVRIIIRCIGERNITLTVSMGGAGGTGGAGIFDLNLRENVEAILIINLEPKRMIK